MTHAEKLVLRELEIKSPAHIDDFRRLGTEADILGALVTLDANDTIALMHGRRYRLITPLTPEVSAEVWTN